MTITLHEQIDRSFLVIIVPEPKISGKKVKEKVDDVVPLSLRSIEQQSMSCANWIEGMTFEHICNQQLQNGDLSKIISLLKCTDGIQPSIFELQLSDAAVTYLWNCMVQIELINGCLMYHWVGLAGSNVLLVVPETLKQ